MPGYAVIDHAHESTERHDLLSRIMDEQQSPRKNPISEELKTDPPN
jgi:hypothetical protein